MDVSTVSYSGLGREQETRGEAWRWLVGSEHRGQDRGWGWESESSEIVSPKCNLLCNELCYFLLFLDDHGFQLNSRKTSQCSRQELDLSASAPVKHVAVQGGWQAMLGRDSTPPGAPGLTRGEVPSARKDNP